MEGQTAQSDLATSLVKTIINGGVVIVVGWANHNHGPLSSALSASGKVRFTESPPSLVSASDFFIFTTAANDRTIEKVKKLAGDRLDMRRFTLDGIRRFLQMIADSLGLSVGQQNNGIGPSPDRVNLPLSANPKPETSQALGQTQTPAEVTMPYTPPATPTSPPPSGPTNQPEPDLESRLLGLGDKLAKIQAEEDSINAEIATLDMRRTELQERLKRAQKARELIGELEKLLSQ